jgi:crotonobetainyl-CoA:carnitine CoA-transferase CaiB-like acyl-CoA transferase
MLFHGEGLNYLTEGRNKFHVTLNLNMPEGREILQNLARHADVLIETFQPGTMESWGIGYEHLKVINPKLIFSSLSAFGQFGPLSRNPMPDYDSIAQARSGIQWATGEIMPENKSYDDCPWAVPTKAGPWVAWGLSGTFMALGILSALHYRKANGIGQALDISTAEAYACFDDYALLYYQETGKINERFGNLDVAGWLYCFAPTKDGIVFLGALRLEMWQAFADMLGKWDEWDAGNWKNMIPFTAIDSQLKWSELVFAETRKYTNEQLVNMAVDYGKRGRLAPITAVIAPVCSPLEAMNDPHWTARRMFETVQDPLYGEITLGSAQHKMTETPARTKWACRPVGYDNEHIYLKYLGLGPTRLKDLKKRGVI